MYWAFRNYIKLFVKLNNKIKEKHAICFCEHHLFILFSIFCCMENLKKLFNDLVLKPQYLIVKGIREMMAQAKILDPVDHFIYRYIEDPVYWIWFTNAYKYEIINDSVIPKEDEGCCVFAANHQSIMDPLTSGLAIVHNSKRMAFQLTKSELFEDPVLGNFVAMNQTIPIKRGAHDVEALQKCVNVIVEKNRPVLVYPEGTYGPGNGELLPFKSGVSIIAWDAQVPVIPMATYGIDRVLPKGNFKEFKMTGLIKIKFGEPLPLATLFPNKKKGDKLDEKDLKYATGLIQTAVQGLWNEMNKEYGLYV
jgi:1-acyl-sn-glycerol-3-phosphate acyltransferase